MVYDPLKQYRCFIVRGKALTDLDNLLPAYASILQEICPTTKDSFAKSFNTLLVKYLPKASEKTLDNHRTEIAGKLFGMYYEDRNMGINISERTLKLLEDSDQPAFFKDLCAKYQFPSGANKMRTVQDQLSNGIKIRQLAFVMKVILELYEKTETITKKEVGYYILNSLDVLSGKSSPSEVISQILQDRQKGIEREVGNQEKASSYNYQHINEQINLLVLANSILVDGDNININKKEMKYIYSLSENYKSEPAFNFYRYNLLTQEGRKEAELDWGHDFSLFSDIDKEVLITSTDSLLDSEALNLLRKDVRINTTALGDEGEDYVYNIEYKLVASKFPRLTNKIKKLGKIKGLGYDIQSVVGFGSNPDWVKYIEVKTTKRVTPPTDTFSDTINLTRNEWVAAEQHTNNFYIYRVYFSQRETRVFIIQNPAQLHKQGKLYVVPLSYRVDFTEESGEFICNA